MARQQEEPQIAAEEDGRVGLQSMGRKGSEALRSRVPGPILEAMQAEDGQYLHYTLYTDGVLVATLISEDEARPRSIIKEKQASAKQASKKAGTKKASKKGPAKRVPARGNGLDDVFGGDEDDAFDDGSEPAPSAKRRPVAVAGNTARKALPPPRKPGKVVATRPAHNRRPVPVGSSVRTPKVSGPIDKPGAKKRGVRFTNSPE